MQEELQPLAIVMQVMMTVMKSYAKSNSASGDGDDHAILHR